MPVSVKSVGLTRIDRHFSKGLHDLAVEAVDDALRDAGVDPGYVVVATSASLILEPQLDIASYVASNLGLRGSRALAVEAGEASGLAALLAGYRLASSTGERVLVVGVDKLTDVPTATIHAALKHVFYRYGDAVYKIGHAGIAGLLASLYMDRFGVDRETMSYWPAIMHSHAKENPYAMLRFSVKPEKVASAMPVATPLTLLDMFPIGDGAAAVLLDPQGGGLARLESVESATGPASIAFSDDPLWLTAVEKSWRRATASAGVNRVDVLEVHDSYTIMGLLILESLRLAERGKAAELVAEGAFTVGGDGPLVNPSGGLKARGHPVGATGVYMAAELAMQLSGTFPGVKADGARAGAAVSLNGHGSSAYTAVFTRL